MNRPDAAAAAADRPTFVEVRGAGPPRFLRLLIRSIAANLHGIYMQHALPVRACVLACLLACLRTVCVLLCAAVVRGAGLVRLATHLSVLVNERLYRSVLSNARVFRFFVVDVEETNKARYQEETPRTCDTACCT